MLCGRKGKKIGNNTTLRRDEKGNLIVQHFFTDIVCYKPDGDVTFRRYLSSTTKARLDCAHPMVRFFQRKFNLMVHYKGMVFEPDTFFTTSEASDDLEPVE